MRIAQLSLLNHFFLFTVLYSPVLTGLDMSVEKERPISWQSMLKSLAGVNRMKMNLMGRFTYNIQGFMAVPCWSRWQESTGWSWTSWAGSPITCKGSWQFHVEVIGRSQQDKDEPHGQVHLEYARVHGSSMLKSLAGVNRMKMNLRGRFTYNM
jgi:hypothetical protein